MNNQREFESFQSELQSMRKEIKELRLEIKNLTKEYKKLLLYNRLRDLSIEGSKFMIRASGRLRTRYNKLTKSPIWKEAKDCLMKLELIDSDYIICSYCSKKIIKPKDCILHHTYYNQYYLFETRNITFVHYSCHERIHVKLEEAEKDSEMWI